MGKVVHIVGNLGAIGSERIDAVTLTDRQITSQRATIRVNRSWSQAQLNLELEPCRRDRMPNHGWPALRRLRVIHAPEVIHGIHREGFLPRAPLSQRLLRLRLLPPHSSKLSIPHNLERTLRIPVKLVELGGSSNEVEDLLG